MKLLTAAQVKKAHADIDLLGTDVIDFKAAKKASSAYKRVLRLIELAEDKLCEDWGADIEYI